jgi:aminoglycoside phosphotransferase (APT) family kinase protein
MTLQHDLSKQKAALEVLRNWSGDIIESQIHQTWGDRVVLEARTSRFPTGIVLKSSAEKDVRVEAYAAKCARGAGVPVPEILAEGRDDRLPGQDWFVMRKAEGQPWESLVQSDIQRSKTLDDIGHMFASLHETQMSNYGPLTPDSGGQYRSWSGWLRAELEASSEPLIREGHLPAHFIDSANNVMRCLAPHLEKVRPSLLHGDLGDREVFVDPTSGAVTAIVDWGDALAGDPLYDFARFVAGGPADDERPALYLPGVIHSYVRNASADLAAFGGKVLSFYEMHNAIRNASWSFREERSWIEGLCTRAMSIVTNMRYQAYKERR